MLVLNTPRVVGEMQMRLDQLPFQYDEYDMPMNARPVSADRILQVDEQYAVELAEKRAILATDAAYYCTALPGSEDAQWEALTVLLPLLAAHYPQWFALVRHDDCWHWTNHLLQQQHTLQLGDNRSLPGISDPTASNAVLQWLGLQVQEDLILMDGTVPGTPLVAGHLCFAAGWALGDKLGKSFLAVHREVPQFAARIGKSSDLLLARLKPQHPVGRLNWSIAVTDQLNLAPCTEYQWISRRRGITQANAGERLFLRCEWQTISRLPQTNALLFTIRTTRFPLSTLNADPTRLRHFTNMVKGMPRVTREYKGMITYIDALIDYLEARCREADGLPPTSARGLSPAPPEPALRALAGEGLEQWEAWPLAPHELLEGTPDARVQWLRHSSQDQPFYQSGFLQIQPSQLRRAVSGSESYQVVRGRLLVTTTEGETAMAGPGDAFALAPNTVVTWQIQEPLRLFFVLTM